MIISRVGFLFVCMFFWVRFGKMLGGSMKHFDFVKFVAAYIQIFSSGASQNPFSTVQDCFFFFFLIACMILARDDANNDTLTINCHMVYFNVLEIFIPPMMSREIQPIITNKLWSAICKWEPSHYEDLGQ